MTNFFGKFLLFLFSKEEILLRTFGIRTLLPSFISILDPKFQLKEISHSFSHCSSQKPTFLGHNKNSDYFYPGNKTSLFQTELSAFSNLQCHLLEMFQKKRDINIKAVQSSD